MLKVTGRKAEYISTDDCAEGGVVNMRTGTINDGRRWYKQLVAEHGTPECAYSDIA